MHKHPSCGFSSTVERSSFQMINGSSTLTKPLQFLRKEGTEIGCKGKYAEWLTDDGLLRIEGWARDGLIDEQIAHNMGIAYSTFREWLKKFPALSASLKKGKAPVDYEIENALHKRAFGFEYEETITDIEELPNGTQKKHIRKYKKYCPPDPLSMIFWLKNRLPDKWRDKPNETVQNAEPVRIMIDV